MSVFISYSHLDREFVDKLGAHLVKNRAHVWVDRWELNVGDSIIQRIQDAITGADALIVVLSRASVASEWCRKELESGLLRELDEKRVVVLPALIEDCEIPLFLRSKIYADFRESFEEGLRSTLEAIAGVTSDTLGRIDQPEYFTDWGADSGEVDGRVFHRWVLVDHGKALPYSVFTEIRMVANEVATARYRELQAQDLEWFGRHVALEGLYEEVRKRDIHFLVLDSGVPETLRIELRDPKTGFGHSVEVTSRRLGTDTGKDIVVNWANHLELVRSELSRIKGELTADEKRRLMKAVAEKWLPTPHAVPRSGIRIGRNQPCPCGSGKKYKRCHGA